MKVCDMDEFQALKQELRDLLNALVELNADISRGGRRTAKLARRGEAIVAMEMALVMQRLISLGDVSIDKASKYGFTKGDQ